MQSVAMEEAAVTIMGSLAQAIVPSALLGAIVGVAAIVIALFALRRREDLAQVKRESREGEPEPISEKVAVTSCAVVAAFGLIAVTRVLQYRPDNPGYLPVSVAFAFALVSLVLPALLWRTRLLLLGEGLATIALAVATFLTGFSIGLLFVPLVLLMTWVCLRHIFHHFARPQRYPRAA
jgi:hypothetical protein